MRLDELPWKRANHPEKNKRRAEVSAACGQTIVVVQGNNGLYYTYAQGNYDANSPLTYKELDPFTAQAVLFHLLGEEP